MVRIGARGLALAVLLAVACDGAPGLDGGTADAAPTMDGEVVRCAQHSDCGDQDLYCTRWRCMFGEPGADARGCIDLGSPCPVGQECDEGADACGEPRWCTEGREGCALPGDCDGDGARAPECGGDDCDDADGDRFPGNPEVCDAEGHDEDCDPATLGGTDADADGFVSAACCNAVYGVCGDDCDDADINVNPGAVEVCDGIDNDCDGSIDMSDTPLCPGGTCVSGRCDVDGWVRVFGAAENDIATDVAVDAMGNVYALANVSGMVDFGTGPQPATDGMDIALVSYEANGALRWATVLRHPGAQGGIELELSGGTIFILAANNVGSAITVAGTMIPASRRFLMGADPATGDVLWAHLPTQTVFTLASDDAGGVLMGLASREIVRVATSGALSPLMSTAALLPTALAVRGTTLAVGGRGGTNQHVVVAYSLAGAEPLQLWTRSLFGTSTAVFDLAIDGADRVYVTGQSNTPVTVDGRTIAADSPGEGFLLALDGDGHARWIRDYEGGVTMREVAVDSTDSVWATGRFTRTVNFGNGNVIAGDRFIGMVVRYSSENVFDRDIHFVQPMTDGNEVRAIALDSADGVIIAGGFTGTVDFLGTGARTSLGAASDAFVVRVP